MILCSNQVAINEIPVSRDGSRNIPNATQHNIPAWTIFAMFFIVISLGSSVVREKLNGSFVRLKTLPTNYLVALFSKQITYLFVTLLQAAVIFSIGIWLFPSMGLPKLNFPADISGLFIVTFICRLVCRKLCHLHRCICTNTGTGQWHWRCINCINGCNRRFTGTQFCHAGIFQD